MIFTIHRYPVTSGLNINFELFVTFLKFFVESCQLTLDWLEDRVVEKSDAS